jgi:hypothetical protein
MALYLGNGRGVGRLSTEGTTEKPAVAIYSAEGVLLAAKTGRFTSDGVVRVTWAEERLSATPVTERDNRAPHARYRATVPAKETK